MNYQLVFRSPFGQIGAYVIAGIGVFFLVAVWIQDGFFQALQTFILPLTLAFFTWWLWAWPEVVADERGVLVRNQVRTYRISWDAFVVAEAKFGLYLYVTPNDASSPSSPSFNEEIDEIFVEEDLEETLRTLSDQEKRRLTIGEVAPIVLNAEDLTGKKAIYAAGVPARGGIRAASSRKMPEIPELNLGQRNRVVLRVTPMAAARILDEEKFYLDNPHRRPTVHLARTPLPSPGAPYKGVGMSLNLPQVGIFIGLVLIGAWLLFGL